MRARRRRGGPPREAQGQAPKALRKGAPPRPRSGQGDPRPCRPVPQKNNSSPLRQSARGLARKSAGSPARLAAKAKEKASRARTMRRRYCQSGGGASRKPPKGAPPLCAAGGSAKGAPKRAGRKGMQKKNMQKSACGKGHEKGGERIAARKPDARSSTARPRWIVCQNHLNRLLGLGLLASAARAASSWAKTSRCLTILSKAALS